MRKLEASDLMGLEAYHKSRLAFREKVMAHKRDRRVAGGPNATLYFEDRLTIQYQVQEMLRIERIFESEAIEEELQGTRRSVFQMLPACLCTIPAFAHDIHREHPDDHVPTPWMQPEKWDHPDRFRQLDEILPTPSDVRTASGAPGPGY